MPVNWTKPVTVSVAMTNLRVMPDQTMSKKKKKKKKDIKRNSYSLSPTTVRLGIVTRVIKTKITKSL